MNVLGTVTRPWLAYGLGVLALVLGAATVLLRVELSVAQAAQAKAEKATEAALRQAAEARETQQRVSRETMQAYRQLEAAFNETIREAIRVQTAERASNARFAALRAERDELRNVIDAYAASGGGAPSDDSLAACRERAAALGVLLVEGVQVQVGLADAAEGHATDVRALRSSWPVAAKAP